VLDGRRASLDLRKFAPEIRELIFQQCIDATIQNKRPVILLALRSDPELTTKLSEDSIG
jgi:hypothetical protein